MRPSGGSKLDGLKDGVKKGLKYAIGGAVFYFAVSLALGGRERVKHDLEVLKVCKLLSCRPYYCLPSGASCVPQTALLLGSAG